MSAPLDHAVVRATREQPNSTLFLPIDSYGAFRVSQMGTSRTFAAFGAEQSNASFVAARTRCLPAKTLSNIM